MARSHAVRQVFRPHEVRNRVLEVKSRSGRNPTRRAVSFLLATVESTERLRALAKDALFQEDHVLIPIEDVDPTVADFARSMILFAGAGIDATMKQLVRDCIRHAVDNNASAAAAFQKHVEKSLQRDGTISARALCSANPREHLIDQYVGELTGGSFQSFQQIAKAAAALGVGAVSKRKETFDRLFMERNFIAHELDLLDPEVHGMNRRARSVQDAWGMAEDAYAATLDVIEHVGDRFA